MHVHEQATADAHHPEGDQADWFGDELRVPDGRDSGYAGFSLAGGQQNSQILSPGDYTAKEIVPLGWVLTGIGGSSSDPLACTVSGSGGSTGSGNLNTQTVSVTLKYGDTVTCVFENTGQGVTRTQGFWATHPQLAHIAWFGGTDFRP